MKTPAPTPKTDVTPTLARQVIDLYSAELADVSFPGLDLSSLLHAQAQLHAAQVEVERVQAELEAMRGQVEANSQALTALAERGLAYARVFAQGDDELGPRIAEIGRRKSGTSQAAGVPAKSEASGPTRRGRKRKTEKPDDLFAAPDTDPESTRLTSVPIELDAAGM